MGQNFRSAAAYKFLVFNLFETPLNCIPSGPLLITYDIYSLHPHQLRLEFDPNIL